MRAALCLSGQFRCFKKTYPSVNEHLIKPLNPDVYISTWDYTWEDPRNYQEGSLTELIDLYQPIAWEAPDYSIQDRWHFNDLYLTQHREADGLQVERVLAMWHKIRRAFELTLATRYDLYIRCRTDLRFITPIPADEIESVLSSGLIGIPLSRDYEVLRNDQFAFGNFKAMDVYTKYPSTSGLLTNNYSRFHPEKHLLRHLVHSGLATLPSNIQYRVLRNGYEENPCLD